MIAVIETHQLFKHADLFAPFYPVYLTLAGNPKQILEHQPVGARLKLRLWQAGHIVAIIGGHKSLTENAVKTPGTPPTP